MKNVLYAIAALPLFLLPIRHTTHSSESSRDIKVETYYQGEMNVTWVHKCRTHSWRECKVGVGRRYKKLSVDCSLKLTSRGEVIDNLYYQWKNNKLDDEEIGSNESPVIAECK